MTTLRAAGVLKTGISSPTTTLTSATTPPSSTTHAPMKWRLLRQDLLSLVWAKISHFSLTLQLSCFKPACWETYLGQQFYRLSIVDFWIQVAIVFLVDVPRVKLFGRCVSEDSFLTKFTSIEFNVTKHVLDIVYSQTICWISVFYAPLMFVVTLLKSFVLFYLRLFYVLYVSQLIILCRGH